MFNSRRPASRSLVAGFSLLAWAGACATDSRSPTTPEAVRAAEAPPAAAAALGARITGKVHLEFTDVTGRRSVAGRAFAGRVQARANQDASFPGASPAAGSARILLGVHRSTPHPAGRVVLPASAPGGPTITSIFDGTGSPAKSVTVEWSSGRRMVTAYRWQLQSEVWVAVEQTTRITEPGTGAPRIVTVRFDEVSVDQHPLEASASWSSMLDATETQIIDDGTTIAVDTPVDPAENGDATAEVDPAVQEIEEIRVKCLLMITKFTMYVAIAIAACDTGIIPACGAALAAATDAGMDMLMACP